jgi:hypothetical protein
VDLRKPQKILARIVTPQAKNWAQDVQYTILYGIWFLMCMDHSLYIWWSMDWNSSRIVIVLGMSRQCFDISWHWRIAWCESGMFYSVSHQVSRVVKAVIHTHLEPVTIYCCVVDSISV